VACDDRLVLADQDRVGEAERGDRGHDLRHLTGGMGARIADIGHQPVGRHHLDLHGRLPKSEARRIAPGPCSDLPEVRAPAHPMMRTRARTQNFYLSLSQWQFLSKIEVPKKNKNFIKITPPVI
jgi:hypothetical protein